MTDKIEFKHKLDLTKKHEAKEFQAFQIEAIQDLEYAAIFDEQGLGKTKIAIDIFIHWLYKDYIDTIVIFTKKTLVANWSKELRLHTNLNPKRITSDKTKNYEIFNTDNRVIIAGFESLISEYNNFNFLTDDRRVGVILDESTKIKNPASKISTYYHNISQKFLRKLILTGTPVANRPYDIWSQIYFLDQGDALGTNFASFKRETDLPKHDLSKDESYSERLLDIFPKLSDFCFRETKESVNIKLPEIETKNIICSWEPEQLSMHQRILNETELQIIRDGVTEYDISNVVIKKLLRFVQVASNPCILDEKFDKQVPKYQKILEIINSIPPNEKVIIWTSFVSNVKWLIKKMKSLNIPSTHLYGQQTIDNRNENVEKFLNNKDIRILIATPSCAKEGLTLTCANHAIYLDRNFTLDDYLQSKARIHRISQTKNCFVYILQQENSIDQWIDNYLRMKELAAKLTQQDISQEEFNNQVPRNLKSELLELLGD